MILASGELAIYGGVPVRRELLVFGKPEIKEEEVREVSNTLRSGWLGNGPKAREFEKRFAEYTSAKHAVALNSCTAGLHLALLVAGVGAGDEVITTPMTFGATANVIIHCGAVPVFVDVDPRKHTLETINVEAAITPRTKAILPVHFGGRACDMGALQHIAQRHNLYLIEDAAHAIEAVCCGRKIGSIGDFTCFSFYVTKNVVTGEGGMVTTSSEEGAARVRRLSLHGLDSDSWERFSDESSLHYDVLEPGFNFRMSDIQASLGLHQLARVELNYERRKTIWDQYNDAFSDLPVFLPPGEDRPNSRHALHLYTLLLDIDNLKTGRDFVVQALKKENIGTGIHYRSLHLHAYYRKAFGFAPGDFPNASWISERTFSLPIGPGMSAQDIEDVVHAVRKVIRYFTR